MSLRKLIRGHIAKRGTGSRHAPAAEAASAREERHDVVIVGSGIGGAITACRLAEAGIGSVVLERGRHWPLDPKGGTFPHFPSMDRRLIWLDDDSTPFPPLRDAPWSALFTAVEAALPRSTGLLDVVTEEPAVIVCGAGVGGGTLVYGAVLAQPPEPAFRAVFPALDHDRFDQVHYPRARDWLDAAPFPADLLDEAPYAAHALFDRAARATGLPVETIRSAFDFDAVRDELRGTRPRAATVGQYHFTGCDSGARASVDRTCLARARATGLTSVRALHRVTSLEQDRPGGYRVLAEHLAEDGTVVDRVVFRCGRLVLAAGVHTPRLLLAARRDGGLPHLHPSVGEGWGANGDHLAVVHTSGLPADTVQGGPSATMVHDATGTVGLMHSPLAAPLNAGGMVLLGMGTADRFGRWTTGPDGRVRLDCDARYEAGARARAEDLMREVTGLLPDAGLTPVNPSRPVVTHATGGVRLGTVTDWHGRLRGHPGLYCLDGALLPGTTGGVNPALTIAAVVDHCLDGIIDDFRDQRLP